MSKVLKVRKRLKTYQDLGLSLGIPSRPVHLQREDTPSGIFYPNVKCAAKGVVDVWFAVVDLLQKAPFVFENVFKILKKMAK